MTYQIIRGNKESGIVRQIFGGEEVVCINGGLHKFTIPNATN